MGLKSGSHSPEKFRLLHWRPFKNDEKCSLFYLKSSFSSQDILVFIATFCSCRKNGLIRKIRLISKIMTSQTSKQIVAIHILPNISRSKGKQTIKLGQLIEYKKTNIFLQKLWRKWSKEISSKPIFIFQKCLIWDESTWSQLDFNIIW